MFRRVYSGACAAHYIRCGRRGYARWRMAARAFSPTFSVMSDRSRTLWASQLPGWSIDAALAAALAVLLVGARAVEAHGLHGSAWPGYLLTVAAAALLAARRRWPLAVVVATLALAVLVIALASPSGAISLPVVIAVYTLAQVQERRRAALLALLAGVALALTRGLFQYRRLVGCEDGGRAGARARCAVPRLGAQQPPCLHRPDRGARRRG